MISASSRTLPPPGARVRLRGAAWSVVQHTPYDDCVALQVTAPLDAVPRTFLLPFDRLAPAKDRGLRLVSPRTWLHRLLTAMAATYPLGGLRSPAQGLDLLPFQLEPALAMLRHGHPRLLIADDVGMGKTIEAGVVLRELATRRDGFRALILVPAGLRQQWQAELRGKFAVVATIAEAAWLRDAARMLPPDVNPWSPPGTYIASFDFVKRPEALRGLEVERWDVVVVDEAHACSATTDRRAAVDAAARRAHRVLLLTATPPPTAAELDALIGIGASDGAPAPMLRRCRDAARDGRRRSVLLAVRLTAGERRMHRLLARYTRVLWRGTAGAPALQRLLGTVLQKRALSSAASLGRSLRRRRELLDARPASPSLQLLLPLGGLEEDAQDDCVADGLLAAAAIDDPDTERRWLTRVIAAAEAAADAESKTRTLVKLLRRVAEPAIVFTEYRDTLQQLHAAMRNAGVAVCVLHGGLSRDERRAALSAFAHGRHVLLATDTAAEGLNLQHGCRLVIHYELPWNPARMLQRAGRVDRFGQRRRVHETALVARDTAEALVLAPLVRRGLRSSDTGSGQRMIELLSESRVAGLVFEGGAPEPPLPSGTSPVLRVDYSREAHAETGRLLQQRRLAASLHPALRGGAGLPVAMVRLRDLEPGVVLVFEVTFTGPNADVEERDLIAIHLETGPLRWRACRRVFGRRLARVLPGFIAAAGPIVQRVLHERLQRLQPAFAAARRRARQREEELRAFDGSTARTLVQRGLFERRHTPVMPASTADDSRDPAADGPPRATIALSASSELFAVLVAVHR